MSVESVGQVYEKGYRGVYVILVWNDWNTTMDVDAFEEIVMRSRGKKKHLVFVPVSETVFGDGEIIEETFSEETLNPRIMDISDDDGSNRRLAIKKYQEWRHAK